MPLLSSRLKVFFIIAFLFPCYSENGFVKSSKNKISSKCEEYDNPAQICTREYYPVCATNGKTYGNRCVFCLAMIESGNKFKLSHFGEC